MRTEEEIEMDLKKAREGEEKEKEEELTVPAANAAAPKIIIVHRNGGVESPRNKPTTKLDEALPSPMGGSTTVAAPLPTVVAATRLSPK